MPSVISLTTIRTFSTLAYSKKNVDDMAKRLKEDGLTILSKPRTTGDGYYECAIADPEGNYVEITAGTV